MIDQQPTKVVKLAGHPAQAERLWFRVELRRDGTEDVERVLARAISASLAGAIFKAARDEYPDRHIVLCRGTRVIKDSAAD
jgi:hypothetical protein